MRFSPCCWMDGSATPNWSTRLRMVSRPCRTASWRIWAASRDAARAKRFGEAYIKRHPEHGDAYLALGSYNYYVAIAPAFVKTHMVTGHLSLARQAELRKMIPVGRFCELEEFAHCVLFLAHPRAGFITGEVLDLNGGLQFD